MFKNFLIRIQRLIQKFRKVPQADLCSEVEREYIDDPTVEVIQTNKDRFIELSKGDVRAYVSAVVQHVCQTIVMSEVNSDYVIPDRFLIPLLPHNKHLYVEMFKSHGFFVVYCEESEEISSPFLKIYRL